MDNLSNKDTILDESDKALGFNEPPSVEYYFVCPRTHYVVPWLNLYFSYNFFGHSAV